MDVCIVTPGHLAAAPRVVKEATALSEAGYSVALVSGDYFAPLRAFDAAISREAPWKHFPVRLRWRLVRAVWRRIQKGRVRAALSAGRAVSWQMAADAHYYLWRQLARAGLNQKARLYIGHGVAGLAAAAWAANKSNSLLGFDAEDYHAGETDTVMFDAVEQACIRKVEASLIPRCGHLTAAAPLIAEAYQNDYGLRPTTLLNVFPLSEAPKRPAAMPEAGILKAYWFSQTIGPGRGLEAFIRIASYLPARLQVELHLRGAISEPYRAQLQEEALAAPSLTLHLHGTAHANEMANLAAEHDIGICLEESSVVNREVCLTNKIFTYILAGVPVLLSSTKAHRALAPSLGRAALLVDLSQPAEAAASLAQYFADPAANQAARDEAWRLGRERYNWDLEQKTLQGMVDSLLKGPARREITG